MRVAIAEDSVLLREGVARLLSEAGCEVIAQCCTADDLLLKVRSYAPDVAVVDIRLPPTYTDEGLRAALEIRAEHPSVGVLVLSQYVELGLALKLLADSAEGVGYLLKDRISDVDEFVAAVRRVADGGSALDPIIVSTLLSRQRSDDPLDKLTPREREVLELMATGSSNQGIADKLVITLRAVEKHVSSIFGKLGLPSGGSESRRVLAVLLFLRACRRARAVRQKPAPPEASFPPSPTGSRLRVWPGPFAPRGAAMKTRVIQDEPQPPESEASADATTAPTDRRNLAARAGHWSATHRKKAIFGWLGFVVLAVLIGQMAGQKTIFGADQFNGESGRAEHALEDAGLRPNDEVVLVQSKNLTIADPEFRTAIEQTTSRLSQAKDVKNVK